MENYTKQVYCVVINWNWDEEGCERTIRPQVWHQNSHLSVSRRFGRPSIPVRARRSSAYYAHVLCTRKGRLPQYIESRAELRFLHEPWPCIYQT